MEKQSFKIVLNHDGKLQEKCLKLFSLTSQKSKLVTFALSEMIEKYGLEDADEEEIKLFIKGYKVLSRVKDQKVSIPKPAKETSETRLVKPKVEEKTLKPVFEREKVATTNPMNTAEEEMEINPNAFSQMLGIMSGV